MAELSAAQSVVEMAATKAASMDTPMAVDMAVTKAVLWDCHWGLMMAVLMVAGGSEAQMVVE